MKSLLSRQRILKSMGPSRVANSYANHQKWAKIELVQDFMAVLIIYKFVEDTIKNVVAITQTTFSPLYVNGRLMGK